MIRRCIHSEGGRQCTNRTARTRCPVHQRLFEAARGGRELYGGDWARRSREQVKREPRCRYCGAETDLTADHLVPGDPDSQIVTACRSCNSRLSHQRGRRR